MDIDLAEARDNIVEEMQRGDIAPRQVRQVMARMIGDAKESLNDHDGYVYPDGPLEDNPEVASQKLMGMLLDLRHMADAWGLDWALALRESEKIHRAMVEYVNKS